MELSWKVSAQKQFLASLRYVLDNFGESAALRAQFRIENLVEMLKESPSLGQQIPFLPKYEIRRLVVNPVSIYYLVETTKIYVLALVDQRMSPRRIMRLVKEGLKE